MVLVIGLVELRIYCAQAIYSPRSWDGLRKAQWPGLIMLFSAVSVTLWQTWALYKKPLLLLLLLYNKVSGIMSYCVSWLSCPMYWTQVLMAESECGFNSQSWHLWPSQSHSAMIAPLYTNPGVLRVCTCWARHAICCGAFSAWIMHKDTAVVNFCSIEGATIFVLSVFRSVQKDLIPLVNQPSSWKSPIFFHWPDRGIVRVFFCYSAVLRVVRAPSLPSSMLIVTTLKLWLNLQIMLASNNGTSHYW